MAQPDFSVYVQRAKDANSDGRGYLTIDLYHHGSSVCAGKVRFALGEKNLAWQGHYLDILRGDQFAPEYQKLNPKAVVSTLVHDGNVIVESTIINEYIDREISAGCRFSSTALVHTRISARSTRDFGLSGTSGAADDVPVA